MMPENTPVGKRPSVRFEDTRICEMYRYETDGIAAGLPLNKA